MLELTTIKAVRLPNGNVVRMTVDDSTVVVDRFDLPLVDRRVQVQVLDTGKFYLEGGDPAEARDGPWVSQKP